LPPGSVKKKKERKGKERKVSFLYSEELFFNNLLVLQGDYVMLTTGRIPSI